MFIPTGMCFAMRTLRYSQILLFIKKLNLEKKKPKNKNLELKLMLHWK